MMVYLKSLSAVALLVFTSCALQADQLCYDKMLSEHETTLIVSLSDTNFAYVPENIREVLVVLRGWVGDDLQSKSLLRQLKVGVHVAFSESLLAIMPKAIALFKAQKDLIDAVEYGQTMDLLMEYQTTLETGEAVLRVHGNDVDCIVQNNCKFFCNLLVSCSKNGGNLVVPIIIEPVSIVEEPVSAEPAARDMVVEDSAVCYDKMLSDHEILLIVSSPEKNYAYVPENIRELLVALRSWAGNDQQSKALLRQLKIGMHVALSESLFAIMPKTIALLEARKRLLDEADYNEIMGLLVVYHKMLETGEALLRAHGDDADCFVCNKCTVFCSLLVGCLKNGGNLSLADRIAAEKAAEEARIAAEKAAEEARIAAEKAVLL